MRNLETSLILLAGCLLIVAGQYTKIYEEEMKPLAEECAECLGVGPTEKCVVAVYKHKKLTTMTSMCMQYCVYHKLGAQNGTTPANEKFLVEAYKKIQKGDQNRIDNAEKNVKECTEQGKLASTNDPCKVAAAMQECYRTQK